MGFITQKYLGGICTLIIQMRCLLNALQLWHKCCQHVHMFQAWSNNSHAHEQFYLITKGPGLAALPWVPSLIPGDFCRQILFPILLVVLCSLLLHGDPWATGSDLREGDVSLGMFPWGCCELGHVLGSSAASPVSHTLTELFSSPSLSSPQPRERLLWLPSAQIPVLQDTDAHSRNRNSLWSVGGGGTRQFLPYIYPHEPDLCADPFCHLHAQRWIKLIKCPGPAWCKSSHKATDPFQVGMGLTWCETPPHTYAMFATSPWEGSALRHHWLQQHQWPTALLAELSCETSSGASLSSSPL